MTSFDPQSASQTRAGVWEPSLDQHARLDAEMIRQTPWDPAAGRTGAGQGTDAAATRIDGEATNEGGRTRSQTTDGKPVLIDPLHQSAEVTITRERTAVEQGGQLYAVSDQLVIATGNGNDSVRVTPGSNGALALDVNGERYALDLAAGLVLACEQGSFVQKGQKLATLYADSAEKMAAAKHMLSAAFVLGEEQSVSRPDILGWVDAAGFHADSE